MPVNISTYQPFNLSLHLADNALILGHRNSEWTGHGPILEQDIAISNIALDLVGQARNFYQYAAKLMNESSVDGKENITEDTLAYHRDAWDFKNCLLVEQTNGDWAKTILRQFFFSLYQFYLYEQLQNSKDSTIAAISEKALKEVTYHVKWSSEWVIRLGDGTNESHERILKALDDLWKFTEELFIPADYELEAANKHVGIDPSLLKSKWFQKVIEIFEEATIPIDNLSGLHSIGFYGKEGKHSEHLGYILAEMQFVQRAYPNCEW
ncbi:MAG: phenylacetate-CoA oxygenase subunit PaaC [Bacteroidetes bacterium]|nr:phenylacetate-CoA oxygenase subunit PaaC [Bacteroidota bacterium]